MPASPSHDHYAAAIHQQSAASLYQASLSIGLYLPLEGVVPTTSSIPAPISSKSHEGPEPLRQSRPVRANPRRGLAETAVDRPIKQRVPSCQLLASVKQAVQNAVRILR